ncbi:MAG TPA: hypothetical protein VFH38_11710 [Jatrophihabitans sp.]|nr:hypothetical protein [Jatrophihabitans sp.]
MSGRELRGPARLVSAAALGIRPQRLRHLPVVLTAVLCSLIAAFARWGPDWPAQEYRALLSSTSVLSVWDNNWYGGTAMAGYSLVYPLISYVLGVAGTGVFAAVLCAFAATRLPLRRRARDMAYGAAVSLTLAASLLIGQIPLLLGVGFGLAAVRKQRAGRLVAAGVLAALCSLSSPLAGAFLLLVAVAFSAADSWRQLLPYAATVTGFLPALLLGGASGPDPCPWGCVAGTLALAAGIVLLVPRDGSPTQRVLYRFAGCYVAFGVLVFLVPNPIGGNLARLGWLIALPLACWLLPGLSRARLPLGVLALAAALTWTLVPVVDSVGRGAGDPSRNLSYYSGLLGFLREQNPAAGRVEIPFTRDHWEARWVAPYFPLARGWERQADFGYNSVLYRPLTAPVYRRWLYHNAVRWVALPDVALDPGGQAEGKLLRHPPDYLRPAWHDAHWRVWRVIGSPPIATGDAYVADLDTASVTLVFRVAGASTIHLHYSPLWHVVSGVGCASATRSGWLRVTSPRRGRVVLSAGVNGNLLSGSASCTG